MDKVSIITVCYNAGRTIKNTIESVIEQDYANYEYIIVDGHSTDDTLNIVKKYLNHFSCKNVPITVISETDNGIYDAMNKGINIASGAWIIFMNADDSFYNINSLSRVFKNDLSTYDVVYGDCIRLDGQGEYPMKANMPETLPKQVPFVHQAVFVRSELYKKYKFDMKYKLCADYDFFFKIFCLGYRFKKIDVTICNYSICGISGKALIEAHNEVVEIKKNYGNIYKISLREKIKWKIQSVVFRIKMIIPEKFMRSLRKIKHN